MAPKERKIEAEEKKTYTPPEIIHDIEFEVRAGSTMDELPPGLSGG